MRFCCLFVLVKTIAPFKIAIAGAHGGLGRELVQQSLERRWQTHALVRRLDPIFAPVRHGWLNEDATLRIPIKDKRLRRATYDDDIPSYDAIVFALSGAPFEDDDTDEVVARVLSTLPQRCNKVCLVSAYGVGDSIKNADLGIRAMNKFYLKDTYRAKRIQEQLVCSVPNVETAIFRPRVLSYGRIPYNPISTTRQDLARTILDWMQS